MAGEDVVVTIGADATAAANAVTAFQGSSAANFVLIGQQIDRVIGQFSQIGDSISRGFGTAVDAFADVDQNMANVRSIVSGTNDEFERMEALAVDIASDLPTSTAEVARGFFQLASAGLDANEIMATTPAIMDLAVASATDFETAANGVTAAMFTYGLELGDVNKITDIFQNTNVGFKTTMPELAESMKFAGASAANMGISMEETALAIGLARNAGLDASTAGTGFRQVMTSLLKPSDAAAEAQEKFGAVMRTNVDGSLDLAGTFAQVKNSLDQMEGPVERSTFLTNVFGVRGAALAGILAQNSGEIDTMAEGLTASGAVQAAVTIQMEGMTNQMDILNGTILDQQAALGEKLAPAELKSLELKLKMFEAVNALPAPFVEWGGGILLVGAEMGKLIFPLIQMILQTGLMFAAMSAQTAATTGATVATGAQTAATGTYTISQMAANLALSLFPAVLIIIAIIALIAVVILLVKHWDEVVTFMTDAWSFLTNALQAFLSFYVETWTRILSVTIEIFQGIGAAIMDAWNAIVDFTVGAIEAYIEIWVGLWSSIIEATVGAVTGIIDGIRALMADIGSAFVAGITGAVTGVQTAIGSIGNTITSAIQTLISGAFTWGADMVANFVSGIVGSIPSVGGAASGLLDTVTGWIGFDITANDRMAEKWGADAGGFFAQGLRGAVGEVSVAGGDLVGAVAGGSAAVAGGGAGAPINITFGPGSIAVSGTATIDDGRNLGKGLREEFLRSGVFSGRGGGSPSG